ncbi:MAG TPA: rRNA maturation RNase YbeY [Rhizomicrobium sp.]|nr:rRNA maturation RNase YbeY [Rhizomicrobium sp.]
MKAPDVTVIVEDERWKKARSQVKRAALAAYVRVNADAVRPFTILLTTDRKLRTLNANFRGKDKPTNVLSFPSDDPDYLGDIAIAYGVAAREAKAEGKSFTHHAAHLAVHGVLHLLGFDHERPRDARLMEPLEIEILAGLKIPNPYLSKAA